MKSSQTLWRLFGYIGHVGASLSVCGKIRHTLERFPPVSTGLLGKRRKRERHLRGRLLLFLLRTRLSSCPSPLFIWGTSRAGSWECQRGIPLLRNYWFTHRIYYDYSNIKHQTQPLGMPKPAHSHLWDRISGNALAWASFLTEGCVRKGIHVFPVCCTTGTHLLSHPQKTKILAHFPTPLADSRLQQLLESQTMAERCFPAVFITF